MKTYNRIKIILLSTTFTLVSHLGFAGDLNSIASSKNQSQVGGSNTGGGNAKKIITAGKDAMDEQAQARKEELIKISDSATKKFIESGLLSQALINVTKDSEILKNLPEKYQDWMNQMLINDDLIKDINFKNFEFKDYCEENIDGNLKEVSISTANKQPHLPHLPHLIGAPICVNTAHIARMYIESIDSEIINNHTAIAPVPAWLLLGLFMHDYARHFGLLDEDNLFGYEIYTKAHDYGAPILVNGFENLTDDYVFIQGQLLLENEAPNRKYVRLERVFKFSSENECPKRFESRPNFANLRKVELSTNVKTEAPDQIDFFRQLRKNQFRIFCTSKSFYSFKKVSILPHSNFEFKPIRYKSWVEKLIRYYSWVDKSITYSLELPDNKTELAYSVLSINVDGTLNKNYYNDLNH